MDSEIKEIQSNLRGIRDDVSDFIALTKAFTDEINQKIDSTEDMLVRLFQVKDQTVPNLSNGLQLSNSLISSPGKVVPKLSSDLLSNACALNQLCASQGKVVPQLSSELLLSNACAPNQLCVLARIPREWTLHFPWIDIPPSPYCDILLSFPSRVLFQSPGSTVDHETQAEQMEANRFGSVDHETQAEQMEFAVTFRKYLSKKEELTKLISQQSSTVKSEVGFSMTRSGYTSNKCGRSFKEAGTSAQVVRGCARVEALSAEILSLKQSLSRMKKTARLSSVDEYSALIALKVSGFWGGSEIVMVGVSVRDKQSIEKETALRRIVGVRFENVLRPISAPAMKVGNVRHKTKGKKVKFVAPPKLKL